MAEVVPVPIYTDRSRHEADLLCRREEWWKYEIPLGGAGGIVPGRPNFDQEFGHIMHELVQALMHATIPTSDVVDEAMVRVGDLCQRIQEPNPDQWQLIAAGLLWGVHLRVLPRIREEYELVSIEQEFEVELARWMGSDGVERVLVYQVTPDTLWRHKRGRHLVYYELKTTGYIDEPWIRGWNKKPQLHTTTWAISQKRGPEAEPIEYVQIVGLFKGRKGWKQEERGLRSSVFSRGWRQAGVPGVLDPAWSHEDRKGKGWAATSVGEFPGGIGEWVAQMPLSILDEQFPMTPPIMYRQDLVQSYLRQVVYREQEKAEAHIEIKRSMAPRPLYALDAEPVVPVAQILDRVWRQNFDACEASHLRFNKDCPYNECCHLPMVAADPLTGGRFVVRTPHHQAERDSIHAAPTADAR